MVGRMIHALRRRIAVKLTLTLVGFVAVSIVLAGLYLSRALERLSVEALETRLATVARLLEDEARALLLRAAPPAEVVAFTTRAARPSESRVTLIALDGRVMADSDVRLEDLGRVENHAGRPEVRAALAGGRGRDLRRSATIDAPLLYVAVPVRDAQRVVGVLRLALPLSAVTASHAAIDRVLLAGAIVALFTALGIGLFVARRLTRPVIDMHAIARQMGEGDLSVRVPVRSPDEIGALGRALNFMAMRLREKIDDLQHEQDKVAAIIDGMVEGVIAVDAHDHILLMNGRARRLFGLSPARQERKPFLEVIRDADLHRILRETRAAEATTPRRHELRLMVGAGERSVEVNAVPFALSRDEVGIVMVLHDVTELRRLERVRTEFVANVSHELRTPLTAIQGYLETLLGGDLGDLESTRRYLDVVVRHAERLGRLLSDLTDLSNIELGRGTLRTAPTPLGEVTEHVLATVRPKAEQGRVTLEARLGPELPALAADRDRLIQILLNLVDNAVKYTPEGGRVTVSAGVVDGGRVEIAVADTGVGIPPADLPRVTERFYRVDRARSRELGGTGLGLAIVKHLVLAHGGELAIASEPGRGTTVRFTMPIAAAAAE
jgi:two-component system phosphate regulon sensor histidine kinase PhoR